MNENIANITLDFVLLTSIIFIGIVIFIKLLIFFITSPEKWYGKYLAKIINRGIEEIKNNQIKPLDFEDIKKSAKERYNRKQLLKKKYWPFYSIFLWAKDLCKYKIPHALYYIKCRLFYRYNIIKIKTLNPTWHDKDFLILHSAFQIFVNFMEKEKPFEKICWNYDSEINDTKKAKWKNQREKNRWIRSLEKRNKEVKKVKKEMIFLYNWWKKTYPELNKKMDMHELGEIENDMLIRLIKIRQYFWT